MAAPGQGIEDISTKGALKRFVEEQVLGDFPTLLRRLQGRDLYGNGSPEGVKDGRKGQRYTDEAAGALYIKTTAAGTLTGWVAL